MIQTSSRTLLLIAATCAAASAAEPTAADIATADALHTAATKQFKAKDYAKACPAFEQSYKLAPRPGTQIHLAVCHHEQGRVATAQVEFRDALRVAVQSKNAEREEIAREHLQALEKEVPKLTVSIGEAVAALPGVKVTRDGSELAQPVWGLAVPVDPGGHVVEVGADGFGVERREIEIERGKDAEVRIEKLKRTTVAPPKPATSASESPAAGTPAIESSSRRTYGWIAGGVGVAGLLAGAVFALEWKSKVDACPDVSNCQGADRETYRGRNSWAAPTIAAVGVGALGVGVGAYLLLTEDRKATPSNSSTAWEPWTARDGAGVSLKGTW